MGNKILINCLCALIPHKATRKKVRRKLTSSSPRSQRNRIERKLNLLNKEINTLFRYHTGLTMMNEEFHVERELIFEPQQAPPDHLDRYLFAAKQLRNTDTVLDCACGAGYGSKLLADRAAHVMGVDLSEATIAWANRYFKAKNVTFAQGDALKVATDEPVDVIVSLETIEHLPDDTKLIQNFHRNLKPGGRLICSTPNETIMPHTTMKNPYHMRHYTTADFVALIKENGFESLEVYYQLSGKETKVRKLDECEGMTIVIVATRAN